MDSVFAWFQGLGSASELQIFDAPEGTEKRQMLGILGGWIFFFFGRRFSVFFVLSFDLGWSKIWYLVVVFFCERLRCR